MFINFQQTQQFARPAQFQFTTQAVGEEGGGLSTSQALGEEGGGGYPQPQPLPPVPPQQPPQQAMIQMMQLMVQMMTLILQNLFGILVY